MGKKIYKYIGPDILDSIFKKDGYCGLKCSYPEDYNDPYELFLSMDFNQTPDILAFYKESVGEVPQKPTTCFSKSPIVIPMWAHYAYNSQGFVLEIDEDLLKTHIVDAQISDITYKDEADPEMLYMIQRARVTMKPRHTIWLWQAMMNTAYFTKQTCWNYEEERRVVVEDENVIDEDGNMILYIPVDCISAIISGTRSTEENRIKGKELTDTLSCNYYDMKIGRSSTVPYLLDEDNYAYIYDDGIISLQDMSCAECFEPLQIDDEETCAWCRINSEDIQNASESNPMNVLAAAGRLESYMQTISDISKK